MFNYLNSLEQNTQKYSFYIKILTNNLPTMQNLNIRYPYLYTTNNCSRCNITEDTLHILLCSKNNLNIQHTFLNIIDQTINQLQISSISSSTLFNLIFQPMLNSNNSYFNNIIPILLGIYSTTSFQNIQNLTKK